MIQNLPLMPTLITTTLTVVLFCILTLVCVRPDTKIQKYPKVPWAYISFGLLMLSLISFLIASSVIGLWQNAKDHGLYYERPWTIGQTIRSINLSPKKTTDLKDPAGCILIYYKFGCEDCEAIYPELKTEVEAAQEAGYSIYWISTRSSKLGEELLEKYPVEEVPTGIYIYQNGKDYIQKVLYDTDENDELIVNTENWQRLLQLQEENR